MTDTELPAGRELDCRIALAVMGWHDAGWDTDRPDWYGAGPDGVIATLPHYSTSIADAWAVVEKLTDTDGDAMLIEIECGGWRGGNYLWTCRIDLAGPKMAPWLPYQMVSEDAETAPLAICRAALRAVQGHTQERDNG